MTGKEYATIWLALRGPIGMSEADDRILDAIADADMKAIQPIVDDMLLQAENRGRLGQMLEQISLENARECFGKDKAQIV